MSAVTARVRAFGGLDENCAFSDGLAFSPAMRNFQVTENHTLKKRGGLTTAFPTQSEVTGLWSGYLGGEKYFLYTAGGILYSVELETGISVEVGPVGDGRNVMFEFQRQVYIKNAQRYSRFDGSKVQEVSGYVPLVAVGCSPDGAGSSFEDVNMLSSRRRVQYSCDGEAVTFRLPEKNIVSVVDTLLDGGVNPLAVTAVDTANGTVTFEAAPGKGINNLEIQYDVGTDRSEVILQASGVMLFGGDTDGHVFLWGNPSYAGYRFHSELADGQPSAEYFPENNYTIIGDSEITDIISQYDRQLIFTKDRAYYSYCELRTDTLGNVYASFPVYNLNGEKGSLLPNAGCIMNNEPVTLCADGLNRWSSTAVENEKNAVCFSGPVGRTMRALLAQGEIGQMRLFNLRSSGELFFFCGEEALVYNYRIGAWYAYDNFSADLMTECDGTLYITRGNRILYLDPTSAYDEEGRVHAYWECPYLHFGENGVQGKPVRIGYTLRATGQVRLQVSYYGGERTPVPEQTEVQLDCREERVVGGSFRPPLQRGALWKLRITEYDYAFCEICELQILAVQKGQYGRKGV